MRETRSSGSVEGVMSNRDPYSDLEETRFVTVGQASRLKADTYRPTLPLRKR
jgi:hypothetical protein